MAVTMTATVTLAAVMLFLLFSVSYAARGAHEEVNVERRRISVEYGNFITICCHTQDAHLFRKVFWFHQRIDKNELSKMEHNASYLPVVSHKVSNDNFLISAIYNNSRKTSPTYVKDSPESNMFNFDAYLINVSCIEVHVTSGSEGLYSYAYHSVDTQKTPASLVELKVCCEIFLVIAHPRPTPQITAIVSTHDGFHCEVELKCTVKGHHRGASMFFGNAEGGYRSTVMRDSGRREGEMPPGYGEMTVLSAMSLTISALVVHDKILEDLSSHSGYYHYFCNVTYGLHTVSTRFDLYLLCQEYTHDMEKFLLGPKQVTFEPSYEGTVSTVPTNTDRGTTVALSSDIDALKQKQQQIVSLIIMVLVTFSLIAICLFCLYSPVIDCLQNIWKPVYYFYSRCVHCLGYNTFDEVRFESYAGEELDV
ncbi:hypothetical protein KM540_gp005 [Western grey kangaroopox virus]|uniref:Uncharacterized protein n=1 Tax=Western grey kangaroopox virus TaxID=1566307 RepID=A0A2C9DSF3_9POXV|nr:hypothetical protein KM540_gp005 [Western grey kangaroopox virus]ATI20936.1 hypothetical protein [Western grey kangaroopox virus]